MSLAGGDDLELAVDVADPAELARVAGALAALGATERSWAWDETKDDDVEVGDQAAAARAVAEGRMSELHFGVVGALPPSAPRRDLRVLVDPGRIEVFLDEDPRWTAELEAEAVARLAAAVAPHALRPCA